MWYGDHNTGMTCGGLVGSDAGFMWYARSFSIFSLDHLSKIYAVAGFNSIQSGMPSL